jgi:hypothetical protein
MRIPQLAIPVLVVIALVGGFFLRHAFTQPSTTATLGAIGAATVECIVDGVKCKGTASLFTSHFEGVAGISTIETFAADHRVVLTYDPTIITPEDIRKKIDSPVALDESTSVAFFKCVSMDETTQTPSAPATQ